MHSRGESVSHPPSPSPTRISIRNSVGFKKALQVGVADADPQARKTARVLYWMMRQRPSWNRPLQLMVDLLDNTTKKHLDTEQYQTEFLEISRNRSYLSNIEPYDLDWKDTDIPQLSRNGSLSSSGRLSVGSDEEDTRRQRPELVSRPVDKMPARGGSIGRSLVATGGDLGLKLDSEEEPPERVADLRAQTMALKTKKQFSASTGNLGKSEGIGGGCQRLTKAPHQMDDELADPVGSIPTKAPLSGSLMAKRFSHLDSPLA
jgi:hypothetical protein